MASPAKTRKRSGNRKPTPPNAGNDPERMAALNPSGLPKELDPGPDAIGLEPGMPTVLRDLLHVYHRPRQPMETVGQRHLRKVLAADPTRFMALMSKHEADWRDRTEAVAKGKAAETGTMDAGSAAGLELVDRLLAERPWEQT